MSREILRLRRPYSDDDARVNLVDFAKFDNSFAPLIAVSDSLAL